MDLPLDMAIQLVKSSLRFPYMEMGMGQFTSMEIRMGIEIMAKIPQYQLAFSLIHPFPYPSSPQFIPSLALPLSNRDKDGKM